MSRFIDDSLRARRTDKLDTDRRQRQEQIDGEIRNFCSQENLRTLSEEVRREVEAAFIKDGEVTGVVLYQTSVSRTVANSAECINALRVFLVRLEPSTDEVAFVFNDGERYGGSYGDFNPFITFKPALK